MSKGKSTQKVYRSAKTGRFVKPSYAKSHKATTYSQTVRRDGTDHIGPKGK